MCVPIYILCSNYYASLYIYVYVCMYVPLALMFALLTHNTMAPPHVQRQYVHPFTFAVRRYFWRLGLSVTFLTRSGSQHTGGTEGFEEKKEHLAHFSS